MAYTALYRKFRPQTFEEVKGQDQTVRILRNQLRSDRIGHAYVFAGTRGTGKTSVAKIFARAVNCENLQDGNPCGECPSCRRIIEGRSLNVIEIDAASNNGVDNIREVIDEVQYSPAGGRFKVYIIDEVHMLSAGAFNALLKTLEEPPAYVIFILATTEVHKIPVTILSRCQRYDFRRIGDEVIVDRLKEVLDREGAQYEEEALAFIARKADGGMRDALSLLDQCLSFYFGEPLTYDHALEILGAVDVDTFMRLFLSLKDGKTGEALDVVEKLVTDGIDLTQFLTDFIWFLRNLMILMAVGADSARIDVSREHRKMMEAVAAETDGNTLIRYIRDLSALQADMRLATAKRVLFEIGLIRLSRPEMETDVTSLTERIRMLEEKLENGVFVSEAERGRYAGDGGSAGGVDAGRSQLKDGSSMSRAELMAAVPADILAVIEQWNQVTAALSGALRQFVLRVKPAAGEGTKLMLVCSDKMDEEALEKPENTDEIRKVIGALTGKDIPLQPVFTQEIKTDDGLVDLSSFISKDLLTYSD